MKFRIKYLPQIGYFGQVKRGLFVWKTIAKHISGYGLYEQNHIDYPLDTEQEARALCQSYEQWELSSTSTPTFIRCGFRRPDLEWPIPPAIKRTPVCNLLDFYESAFELLSFTQVNAIVANARRKNPSGTSVEK